MIASEKLESEMQFNPLSFATHPLPFPPFYTLSSIEKRVVGPRKLRVYKEGIHDSSFFTIILRFFTAFSFLYFKGIVNCLFSLTNISVGKIKFLKVVVVDVD